MLTVKNKDLQKSYLSSEGENPACEKHFEPLCIVEAEDIINSEQNKNDFQFVTIRLNAFQKKLKRFAALQWNPWFAVKCLTQ